MRRLIPSLFSLAALALVVYSCQNEKAIEQANYYSNGQELYKRYCRNCHGDSGEGLGELAPPLTDSVFLKIHKKQLVCIIRNGMDSTISINGKEYSGKMLGFPQIADIDVAQIIVYVTNSFGNNQGMYTYDQVAADLAGCGN